MNDCKHLTIITQETGSPLCKCAVNNIGNNNSCYGKIREKIGGNNVIPNGECPFAYRNIDLYDCPCYKQ